MAKAKRSKREREASPSDAPAMRAAVRALLEAAGLTVAGTVLERTPELVTKAWLESYLDGYQKTPEELLDGAYRLREGEAPSGMVLLKSVSFHGLCPHHLLPFHGRAHVAYLPERKLASLASLARLVDCFAHRLEIQETVTRQIAEAIEKHLGAKGAAVALETDQACLTTRGVERKGTRTVTQHFTGRFADSSELRQEFLKSLESFA